MNNPVPTHHNPFLVWVHDTTYGAMMRDIPWLFPTFQALHLMGMALLIGVIGIIDLRVLGFAKNLPVAPLHRLIPLALVGFSVNVITGVGFFASEPYSFAVVWAFRVKLLLLALAGLNALWFRISITPLVHEWGPGKNATPLAKVISAASLFFWIAIVFAGRFIAFEGTGSL